MNLDSHSSYLEIRYWPALDGLRAFSVLTVIGYHTTGLRPYFPHGMFGVQLFFVISGFLITTLLLREQTRSGTISLRRFYLRRILRIFPAYYLTVGLYLLLCYLIPEFRTTALQNYLHNLPAFLTYTSNWFVNPDASGKVIFVFAWSLATEEQFYLIWPSILKYVRPMRAVALIAILGIAVNQVVRYLTDATFFLPQYGLVMNILNSISMAILLGCLLAIALHHKRSFLKIYRLLKYRWLTPIIFIILAVCVSKYQPTFFPMLAVSILMTLLVAAVSVHLNHGLNWLLENRPIRYIGTISYGLYLYQSIAIKAVDHFPPLFRTTILSHYLTVVIVAIAVASASYWLFEMRFLKLKQKLSRVLPVPN